MELPKTWIGSRLDRLRIQVQARRLRARRRKEYKQRKQRKRSRLYHWYKLRVALSGAAAGFKTFMDGDAPALACPKCGWRAVRPYPVLHMVYCPHCHHMGDEWEFEA